MATSTAPPAAAHGADSSSSPEPLPRFPELYAPGMPFAFPELQALAADGLLTRFHQHGYSLPGSTATPQLRARAAAGAVPAAVRQRVVAGRMTAAWIYGCAAEPDRLALLVDAKRRVSSLRNTRGCSLHEVAVTPPRRGTGAQQTQWACSAAVRREASATSAARRADSSSLPCSAHHS